MSDPKTGQPKHLQRPVKHLFYPAPRPPRTPRARVQPFGHEHPPHGTPPPIESAPPLTHSGPPRMHNTRRAKRTPRPPA